MKIIDVGCGPGIYVKALIDEGLDAIGIDIDPSCTKYFPEYSNKILVQDIFDDTQWQDKQFDICICLEMAEHISSDLSEKLVEILTRISTTIIFSAARPQQGGHGHINCQPAEYWIELFAKRGYVLDTAQTTDIVDYFTNAARYTSQDLVDHYSHQGWFTTNVQIYRPYGDVCYESIIQEETPQAKRLASYIQRGQLEQRPTSPVTRKNI